MFLLALHLPLVAQATGRQYDSEKAELETLNGAWQFYCEDGFPGQAEPTATPHTISVPGTWRNYDCPQGKLPGTGRHRFHLVVTGQMRPYGLALYLPIAGTSMTAYWNGYKIHEAGNVEGGKAGFRTATVPIAFSERNDLIIDVANFDDRYGGLWQAPQIGSVNELRTVRKFRFLMDGLVAGLLAFLALYNLSVFAGVRNRLYLYLGLFTLGISLRSLIESERIAHSLLGPENWYALIRFAHLALYAGFIFFFAYVKRLFALDRWRWWELVPVSGLVAYDIMVLLTPPVFFTEFLNAALVALLTLGLQIIAYTIMAVRRGQRGAYILLGGIILLFAASINDIFFNFAFFATIELVPLALLVFVFMNVFGLELMEFRLRNFSGQLDASIRERRTSLERLVPGLAQRFLQTPARKEILLSSREKLPVRFAALFADLRGFTAIAESRSPEEVFNLINRYLEHVVPPIMANGGQVLEYQGDGILAYFMLGAESCLRAALEMQRELRRGYESGALPELRMGIAMNSGSGILSLLGNEQRLEPVIISPAILEVQDLEMLCAQHQVPYVLSYRFFNELPRDSQAKAKILTDLAGSPVFTLATPPQPDGAIGPT